MLLSDAVKIWMLATLKANVAVMQKAADTIESWGEEVEARPGAFVGVVDDSRGALADSCVIRVRCVGNGEGGCVDLVNAILGELEHRPGRPKTWSKEPGDHHLKLSAVLRTGYAPAERDGPGADTWAATLQFTVRGRDTRSPL